eukprot:15473225-Alexandrium_andersonii.AAC.1
MSPLLENPDDLSLGPVPGKLGGVVASLKKDKKLTFGSIAKELNLLDHHASRPPLLPPEEALRASSSSPR